MAAVVSLMVEEVLKQEAEVLCLLLPCGGAVVESLGKVLGGDPHCEAQDGLVYLGAKLTEFGQCGGYRLGQRSRAGKATHDGVDTVQPPELREAMKPHEVRGGDVVQRIEERAKERASILEELVLGELGGHVKDASVHPVVVFRHDEALRGCHVRPNV